MTLHQVEYAYMIPEWSSIEIDIDEALDYTEKEAVALAEIKEIYDDIQDIEILKMKVIS